MMGSIISFFRKGIAFEWSLIIVAILLPYNQRLISMAIIALSFFWLIKKDLIVRVKEALSFKIFILVVLYYSIHVISYFFSKDKGVAELDLEEKLSLIVFPLLFFGSGGNRFIKREWIEKGFILGTIIAIFFCLVNGIIKSYHNPYTHGVFNISLYADTIDKPWWWLLFKGYSYFTYSNYSFFIHPSYFALYITFALYLLTQKQENSMILDRRKILRYLLVVIFVVNIFLLQSRTGIIGLFIYMIWILFKSYRKTKTVIIYSCAILGIVIIFLFTGRVAMKSSGETSFTWESIKNTEIRFSIWTETLSLIREKPIWGYTIGDAKSVLVERLHKEIPEIGREKNFNAHNEFLETTLKLGLIGLIVLLAVLFYPIIANHQNREVYLFFISIVVLHLLFESMFERFSGVSFIGFFYGYINTTSRL